MAYDNLKTHWHLTSVGWISGDTVPADRVKTCLAQEYQSSMWASLEYRWREQWVSSDHDAVAGLVQQFGDRPKGYEDYWAVPT